MQRRNATLESEVATLKQRLAAQQRSRTTGVLGSKDVVQTMQMDLVDQVGWWVGPLVGRV